MAKKIGAFEISETGTVVGPSEYMKERGSARMRTIEAGMDTLVNYSLSQGGDVLTAVLVSLQTDYAAWQGMKTFNVSRKCA
jgi:hypothetical protein